MASEGDNNTNEPGKFRSREHFFKKHREINSLYTEACAENKRLIEMLGLKEHEITELRRKVADLESVLNTNSKFEGYNCHWKQIQKILFILETDNAAMSSAEILKTLLFLEPKFADTWRNPKKSICRIIGRALKFGFIFKIKKRNEFRYSLINKNTI